MTQEYRLKIRESIKKRVPYRVLSLFCGAGGFDLGFIRAGFDIVLGIDFNKDAVESCKVNFKHPVLLADIKDVEEVPECDVVIGGFPCQGFSIDGKRNVNDKRNFLYLEYVRILKKAMPTMFVAENVKGILTMAKGEVIRKIVKDFSDAGYYVSYILLDAQNYGVPQRRKRVFIFGVRKDVWDNQCRFIFNVTKDMFPVEKRVTLRDALYGVHFYLEESIQRPHTSFLMSVNRNTSWDEVCPTITAQPTALLHPDSRRMIRVNKTRYIFEKNNDSILKTRNFSYRECAAIQTFPMDFYFHGCLASKYKQIGNAVPVNLAYRISKTVKNILDSIL